jgi:hypothetical protein
MSIKVALLLMLFGSAGIGFIWGFVEGHVKGRGESW